MLFPSSALCPWHTGLASAGPMPHEWHGPYILQQHLVTRLGSKLKEQAASFSLMSPSRCPFAHAGQNCAAWPPLAGNPENTQI